MGAPSSGAQHPGTPSMTDNESKKTKAPGGAGGATRGRTRYASKGLTRFSCWTEEEDAQLLASWEACGPEETVGIFWVSVRRHAGFVRSIGGIKARAKIKHNLTAKRCRE